MHVGIYSVFFSKDPVCLPTLPIIPSPYSPLHDKNWHSELTLQVSATTWLPQYAHSPLAGRAQHALWTLWPPCGIPSLSRSSLESPCLSQEVWGSSCRLAATWGALERQETGHAQGQLGYELSQLNVEQRRERQEKIRVYANEAIEFCPQHIKTCWSCYSGVYNGTIGTLCSTHTHTVHIQYTERVSRGVCHNVLFSHLHTEDAGALIIAQGGTG